MERKLSQTWYGIATKIAMRFPNGISHHFWDIKLQTIRQAVSLRSFQTAGSITWISICSIYLLLNNSKIIFGENNSRKFESACFLSSEIPYVPNCKTSTCHPINAFTVFNFDLRIIWWVIQFNSIWIQFQYKSLLNTIDCSNSKKLFKVIF